MPRLLRSTTWHANWIFAASAFGLDICGQPRCYGGFKRRISTWGFALETDNDRLRAGPRDRYHARIQKTHQSARRLVAVVPVALTVAARTLSHVPTGTALKVMATVSPTRITVTSPAPPT